MSTSSLSEQRLTEIEAAVSRLQRCLANLPPAPDRLEQITGSFKDEPAFEEVLAFGRALLAADHWPEDPEEPV
jgi:hypothetical protein